MSSNIIKKCIEELAKPEPRLDYLRGLLEALDDSTQESWPGAYSVAQGIKNEKIAKAMEYIAHPSSDMMPPRPLIIPAADPSLIAKLKGGATVEEMPVPLNAKPQES